MLYKVNDCYAAIQGEGVNTGVPMVILRLHGCGVGCPWCFDGDTLVLMADWSVKRIRDVQVGDLVMSYGGKRSYTISKVVDATQREQIETVKILTDKTEVICTPDHVFHTNHHYGDSERKTPAINLAGKWIKRSKRGNYMPYPPSEQYLRGYLMGAYAGDGSASHWGGYTKIYWQVTDLDFAERVRDIINSFGRNVNITESPRRTKKGKIVYRVSCAITNIEFVMDYPESLEERRGYVAGFFDAEGSASQYSLSICQQDDKLLRRVESMVKDFGFTPAWTKTKVDIRTGKPMHLLTINKSDEVERFFAVFSPAIKRKQNKGRGLSAQLTATRVDEVQDAGRRTVYNLMTTMGNFFANGFLVDQCDTKETWHIDEANKVATIDEALGANEKWCEVSADDIAGYIAGKFPHFLWVMVTGGEPADQNLTSLATALHNSGYKFALETSGTANGHFGAILSWVCVSPKINMPGGKKIIPEVVRNADEIKHVVGKPADIDALVNLLHECQVDTDVTVVCLQPVSQSPKATALCIEAVQQHGWRLSIQIHKLLGEK